LPENPASYRVVRTKSYLFNKAIRMPNRKRSIAVYLGGCLALGIIGSILWPTEKSQPVAKTDVQAVKAEPATPTFEYADKTLKE